MPRRLPSAFITPGISLPLWGAVVLTTYTEVAHHACCTSHQSTSDVAALVHQRQSLPPCSLALVNLRLASVRHHAHQTLQLVICNSRCQHPHWPLCHTAACSWLQRSMMAAWRVAHTLGITAQVRLCTVHAAPILSPPCMHGALAMQWLLAYSVSCSSLAQALQSTIGARSTLQCCDQINLLPPTLFHTVPCSQMSLAGVQVLAG